MFLKNMLQMGGQWPWCLSIMAVNGVYKEDGADGFHWVPLTKINRQACVLNYALATFQVILEPSFSIF